jgi:hypothetical protein
MFYPDTLHCKHLGSDSWFYASALELLTHYHMPGTPLQNLARVWDEIKVFYKEQGLKYKYQNLTLKMYQGTSKSFPRLKGRAAEIKHFGLALLHIYPKFMNKNDQRHRQVRLALMMSCKVEALLDDHNDQQYRMTPTQHGEFTDAIYNFLGLCTGLSTYYHAMRPARMLFNFTIKFHYLIHIAACAQHLHPRATWCYAGEDFMQRIKKLVAACHRGTPPWQVLAKVIKKYAQLFGLSMMDRDAIWRD